MFKPVGFFKRLVWLVLALAATGGPVSGQAPAKKPDATGDIFAAGDPPDLHKYLSADGRFIDRCAYWKDNPDPYTQMYGWPDHFAAGQPMGSTEAYNGGAAPYARCSADPCVPGGFMCWRNPAAKTAKVNGAADVLRDKGCTTSGTKITCPAPKTGPPSTARIPGGYDPCLNPRPPPNCPGQSPTLNGGVSQCHLTPNGGIACDTGDGSGGSGGGGKGLSKTPPPSKTKRPPPTLDAMVKGMNDCFEEVRFTKKVDYYVPPQVATWAPRSGGLPVVYNGSAVLIDANAFGKLPVSTRVFALAQAFGQHAQQLHDAKYGPSPQSEGAESDLDTIIGYLDRCLMEEGLIDTPKDRSPDDPRSLYAAYRGVKLNDERVVDFRFGLQWWPLRPVSLLPPWKPGQ